MKVLCILFHEEREDIKEIAEAFYRYSSQIALREKEALFIEISKSLKLYSQDSLVRRIRSTLKRMGASARLTVAQDVPTALAFARLGTFHKGGLPLDALYDYVSPFNDLGKQRSYYERKLHLLERLGVRNLSRFLALPEKTIVNHLGGEMLTLYDAVRDSSDLPWPFFKPHERIVESLNLEEKSVTSNSLDGMSFLFKSLVDRTVLRLRGRGERLLKFRIRLELEKHSQSEGERHYEFDLSFPHTTARDLLFMIREKLDFDFQKRPLTALVEDIHLEVLDTAPTDLAQKDLFNPKKEEEHEAFRSVLSRIAEKVGPHKVFMAEAQENYRPESSWKKTLKDQEAKMIQDSNKEAAKSGHNFPERPLRLFKKPLRVNQNWFSKAKILDAPEVLASEWWNKGFQRIYFRVRDPHGEIFWVFKTQKEVFIHGVF